MARAANEALAVANKSRNVATRASRVLIAKANLRHIRELSAEYPFLRLISLEAFEESIRQVEQETGAIHAAGPSTNQSDEPPPEHHTDPFLDLPLINQCEFLGIPLEVIRMDRQNREWVFNGSRFKRLESAALAHFTAQGYSGTPCEGAAPLMIMKCASLDYLAKMNPFNSREDACMRFFEAQCWIHSHRAHYIIEEIEASTEATVRAHFREIASYPRFSATYPALDEDALVAIWRAISPSGLAQLASKMFEDPYKYRAGWPDLTLARGNELLFVEVKSTDRLHFSQKVVIGEVLKPWGAAVSVLQIKPPLRGVLA